MPRYSRRPKHRYRSQLLQTAALIAIAAAGLYWVEHHAPRNDESSSQAAIALINQHRAQAGLPPLAFDPRVFALARARAEDMVHNNYYDHTNPITGECPDSLKASYSLTTNEWVAENILDYGSSATVPPYLPHPLTAAIAPWMESRGHRYNLLYPGHVAGAVACYGSKCVFLGLNYQGFGAGCYTGEQGSQFWQTAPLQPGEIPP